AFSLGFNIMKKMYEKEKVSIETLESMLFYIVIATLLGARLGHVFFYDWAYYQDHLMEILLPISSKPGGGYTFVGFRGLASHGAAIGILLGIILYQRNYPYKPLAWILDRLIIPTTLGGAFVRIGNFFNSEIVGNFTGNKFGVVFVNRGESLPRHPAQLYEAVAYFILFFFLRYLYRIGLNRKDGFLVGVFMTALFSIRFLVEFVKASQGGFETFLPALSTGQWLSVPLIIAGIIVMYRTRTVTT
ncbi:MAG: prolipoprotein diacylglyceryl transferase, partial [Flavobacteriaceae bacterium]|nr:prolipoprotein diacylglyceryl transferase [Flavobacteriaceae bacterium]